MSDHQEENPGAHGVHAGARDDGGIGEEGADPPPEGVEDWADKTETGGDAAS